MTDPLFRLRRFLRELKRRNVYRVAVTYAVVGFVVIEAADLVFPALNIPSWAYSLVVVLVLFGFPVALVVAWAYDLTPEGVRRTPAAEEGTEAGAPSRAGQGRFAMKVLVGLGILAAAAAGGWYLTGGGGQTEPRAGERSIAVLPFENMGGEESEQFTRGVHDGLLTRLAHVSGVKVISRQAVEPYRDSDLTMGAIADSLGVRWVMEGAVQKMGEQIQVNAQLIDPRTETHAWADRYRRDLTAANLFDLQSEITKRIARSLEAELTPQETRQVERRPTEDLQAYKLYVQGRTHLDRRTEEGLRRGEESFRQALERDSTYALAWAGLADARSLLASYGYGPQDSLLREARDAARRALELAPELAEAHTSLGLILQSLRRDGPGALRQLRRAVELKPSYARAHHWTGILLATLGRPDEARAPLRRAAELDPTSPPIHVALSAWYYYADSLQRALEEAQRARQLSPGYSVGTLWEGLVLSALGRHEQALQKLRRVGDGTDSGSEAAAWLAVAHLRAGDTARARALLDRLEGEEADFWAGLVRAEMRDHEAALSRLSRARYDYPKPVVLRYEPMLDPLRATPRYEELIREVNRAWGLNPGGSLPDSVDVSFEAGSDG